MKGYIIGLYIAYIIFFIGFFFASKIHYKHKYQANYSIKNVFPFEHNFSGGFFDNIFGNVLLILSSLCLIGFYILALQQGFISSNYFVLLVAAVLHTIFSTSLVFIPLKAIKIHLIVSLAAQTLSFASFGALGFVSLTDFQRFEELASLVIGIIGLVFALIYFVMTMNPNLNKEIKYDTETSEDGTIIYKRPKVIPLALTEWLAILSSFVCSTLTLLLYLL